MDGKTQLQKAYKAILNNDFERAAEWFERAIDAEPNNADYHYRLSITYARSNKLPKAVEHAETAVRLAPDAKQYRFHLSTLQARELLVRAGRAIDGTETNPYLAIALLQQAIALDPLSVEAHLLLAVAADAVGDAAQAMQAVNDALRLAPESDMVLSLLPSYEQKLKRFLGTDAARKPL
ncbi:hypothetical protein SD70_06885 [Gordoniibacillus kamchatkensis]|uniref:Tetratricopeptide repeat protein n=2 Tax=Gordoniibacillus kamchatkensis TaxID=1590651 RepID=A0ABR5ALC9_9BACL|nr:hypothetical protein SD70_06885 [Paenibacillus sp. VKM B-2647]